MGKSREINVIKEAPSIEVKTRICGALKSRFVQDIERGYKPSELMREMARFFYENRAKNSY